MMKPEPLAASLIRTLPVSAASSLIAHQGWLHVVADDDHHLSTFRVEDATFHHTVRLFDGELPGDKKARKKLKSDLEALALLPPAKQYPHGALLAIGSGSKDNRQRAVIVPLNAAGLPTAVERTLDLAPLYRQLPFADLNIEGAFIHRHTLHLLQRGNKGNDESALISCPLADVLAGTATPHITPVSLPDINGVPLGFTDGFALPDDCIVFSAVAEDTGDSYNDGQCVGTAIGLLGPQGQLLHLNTLAEPHKIEGIAPVPGDRQALYAVTDADDPAVPASLMRVELVGWNL